jgi:regulator of protease activity HflC (stomatin/prohibitin superfamily)
MQRAMAKQAEAEREKRAKIIHAQGELQASAQLAQAAGVIGSQPNAIQLRYLQTLTEIAVEKNSTIIFPLPIDLIQPMIETMQRYNNTQAQQLDGTRQTPVIPNQSSVTPVPQYPRQ